MSWFITIMIFIIITQWVAIDGLQAKVNDLKKKYKETENLLEGYYAMKTAIGELTKSVVK